MAQDTGATAAREARPLTDPDYWDDVWGDVRVPIRLRRSSFLIRAVVRFLRREIASLSGPRAEPRAEPRCEPLAPGARLLEVGCGASPWMPFLAAEFGFAVSGVDYSPRGAALARENLVAHGISGEVHEGDFMEFAATTAERFDVVASFGVVEHFEDPVPMLAAMRAVLAPGGRVVVGLPNLRGLVGGLLRLLDRPQWERHHPLSTDDVARALASAGFSNVRARHVGGIHMGIGPRRTMTPFVRVPLYAAMRAYSLGFGLLGLVSPFDLSSRLLSSYLMAVGEA